MVKYAAPVALISSNRAKLFTLPARQIGAWTAAMNARFSAAASPV